MKTNVYNDKVEADSVFKICTEIYHVECQSNPDSTIAVRIWEYDVFISLRNPMRNADGVYELHFPRSCVMYLRHNSDTKDSIPVHVWFNDIDSYIYRIPIIKVQNFSKDDIFSRDLFMLLPFYIMRYEKELDELDKSTEKLNELMAEYKDIVNMMSEAFSVKNDTEGQRLCTELQIIMKKVAEYFLRNQENAKNQIGGTIMGGTCWKTFEEECLEKGFEQGLEQGQFITLISLAKQGLISVDTAASQLNISPEEFKERADNFEQTINN